MMNESMLHALKYAADEVVGKDYKTSFVPERDQEVLTSVFENLIKSHEPTLGENRVLTRDGRELLVEWRGKSILDEHGKFEYFFGMGIDITERKRAEGALKKSEQMFRLIAENMYDMIRLVDTQGTNLYSSPSHKAVLGYSPEERVGKSSFEVVHPDDMEKVQKIFAEAFAEAFVESKPARVEYRTRHADGHYIWLETIGNFIYDDSGQITGGVLSSRDITNRKHAEEEIKRSLREKETLLAEIHHRVKNNMQIISSLLSLQSKDIEDERALSLIKNCEDRIRSMSLVHEKLYLSEDLSSIDFHDYMKDLSARLFQVHRVDSRVLSFSSQIKDVSFNIETAIPLGLIINELISNALKHAFPEGKKGSIAVELTQDKKREEYILTVTDDGIGFPEVTDYRNTETFGLQLVDMLTEQFHGTMELDRTKGTSFRITFREQKYRKRI